MELSPNDKDPRLWEIAQKRVAFKYHLAAYIIVNGFFWVLWYLGGMEYSGSNNLPWPVWPMFGWGIGLLFHFLGAYVMHNSGSVEKEYEKLLKEKK